MGFWDRQFAQQPAPQTAPTETTNTQPSRPWWQTSQVQPQQEQQPAPAEDISVKQQGLFTGGPKAATVNNKHDADGYCPECQGPNYVTVGKQANQSGVFSVQRCYDCGYPVQQQFSGISGVAGEGPSRPARQLSTTNNYDPTKIVDRIG